MFLFFLFARSYVVEKSEDAPGMSVTHILEPLEIYFKNTALEIFSLSKVTTSSLVQ